MNQLRVAVDVGSRFHQVAVGDGSGRLLEEFRVDHRSAGFEEFFARIDRYHADEVRVAMEGYNGWARPLDQQVLDRAWRLYNVNNLKLARYKEIFPAPAKTDAIDARRMLELFGFDEQRSMGREVLQEVAQPTAVQRELKYLTRRRRQLVTDRASRLTRLRTDLLAVCPDLVALTRSVENLWFLNLLTCRDHLSALPRLQFFNDSAVRKADRKRAGKLERQDPQLMRIREVRTWRLRAASTPCAESPLPAPAISTHEGPLGGMTVLKPTYSGWPSQAFPPPRFFTTAGLT